MLVINLLEGFYPSLGLECSGTIVNMGTPVRDFVVRDAVIAVNLSIAFWRDSMMGTQAIVTCSLRYPKPQRLWGCSARLITHQTAARQYGVDPLRNGWGRAGGVLHRTVEERSNDRERGNP